MSRHPFHLVDPSGWPLLMAVFSGTMLMGLVTIMWSPDPVPMVLGLFGVLMTVASWWSDISKEGAYEGAHPLMSQKGLRYGMLLFILSEVLLFFSLFWAYFHLALSPSLESGATWPTEGLTPMAAFEVPLLNTFILLSSGGTVTWAHHCLLTGAKLNSLISMALTSALGVYFSVVQGLEYLEAGFGLWAGGLGSSFYLTTGVHGAHVLIGTLFLMIITMRMSKGQLSTEHHFGFEASAWYWHFVDVVWIMLFITFYWWGLSV